MITLGITGSFADLAGRFMPDAPEWLFHDSAAALVVDGVVVAAVEEERLNRFKHTNFFPSLATQACLLTGGVRPSEIDEVAFFFAEDYSDLEFGHEYLKSSDVPTISSRDLLITRLAEATGRTFEPSDVHFVPHHVAHGFGVLSDSGFQTCLVVVVDGNGEDEGLSVFRGDAGRLDLLRKYPMKDSLGHLYLASLPLMGFRRFDEYKVMGLAPYGDPTIYRKDLGGFYDLLADGGYKVDSAGFLDHFLRIGFQPRRRNQPPRPQDADLAAGLQKILEDVELHVLRHWSTQTGLRELCLSGGVAQNSSVNGSVLRADLFDRVFVHPASHDGGAAAGAAQFRCAQRTRHSTGRRLATAFLGPELGTRDDIVEEVRRWTPFVEWESLADEDEARTAASRIARGEVVGWATGRSEYGPRALGHRSILADPRDPGCRDRVNGMVKKRESFRPFAPAVLGDHAARIFDLPRTIASYQYMSCVVYVRPEWRERLPAVTHVDATARIQIVTEAENPSLWKLLTEFHRLTGVPVLLNTSFNNFAEPIVQSVADALRCLVTTTLDCVVMPGHAIRRRPKIADAVLSSSILLPARTELHSVHRGGPGLRQEFLAIRRYTGAPSISLSARLHEVLVAAAGGRMSLIDAGIVPRTPEAASCAQELLRLWEQRVVDLAPAAAPTA